MRSARLAAAALLLVGCGGSHAPHTRWLVYRDHARHFSVRYPDTWHRAQQSLTPHLANPREILTVSTGPLLAGGSCAQYPTAALRALGTAGALVSVQEGGGHTGTRRPRRFRLRDGYRDDAPACVPGASFRSWIIPFRDHGRDFYGIVALGVHASARRHAQALRVLDSFRAGRRP
jgi:hypothetical protein